MQGTDLLIRVARRLPVDRTRGWNKHVSRISQSREPSLRDLRDWLAECVEAEYNPYAVKSAPKGKSTKDVDAVSFNTKITSTGTKAKPKKETPFFKKEAPSFKKDQKETTSKQLPACSLCKESHALYRCFRFLNKNSEERNKFTAEAKLCQNCLRPNHGAEKCPSNFTCREPGCGQVHHTLLHEKVTARNGSMNAGCGSRPCTFFQLARVYALGNNGRWIPTVAFLDSASEITIIDKSLAKDLGLNGKSKQLTVKTLNAETTEMSQTVTMQLKPVNDPDGNSIRVEEAWVVGDSHFQCPSQRVSADWEHLNGLGLSDIDSSELKLLIGINVARAHLQFDTRIGEDTQPIAVKTPLDWTLLGTSDQATSSSANVNIINAKDAELKEEIERFWRSESFGVRHVEESSLSIEDRKAIQILEETTRLVNGHYEIGMLWRDSESPLPDNKSIASKRHYLLEKKLNRDEDVKCLYTETLEGYVSKCFARKLSEEEAVHRSPKTWYIPHHGVTNVNKPGKIRVVFDAAATCQGISLNDTLMTGPDLLNSLFGVLQRFRVYKIAISADIEAMFHQVRVPSHDADALRFLWKGDTFSMGVHIFGAKDSPTCANYALKRCAMDNIHKYSQEAAETVLKSFYVDDLAKSIHGVQVAIGLAQEVTNICAEEGFRICKWLSNSLEFLESIEESERTIKELSFTEVNTHRPLGLKWKIDEDYFFFDIQPRNVVMTKRGVISVFSQIFDPCGFLAPFVFRAKLFVQELWRAGLDWDTPLDLQLEEKWRTWLDELTGLSKFRLQRWHPYLTPEASDIQLHIFSDASELGFAAVAFVRYEPDDSQIECSLLAAKTSLAPIKPSFSIPRLELQGAVMASRLGNTLSRELHLNLSAVWYWTDSTTVIRYISNETKRFKSFVANRVCEILETTKSTQWWYIPSKLNPADCCSRGVKADALCRDAQWSDGPFFLQLEEKNLPQLKGEADESQDDDEIRKTESTTVKSTIFNIGQKGETPMVVDVTGMINTTDSRWVRLVRRTAWLKRAVKNFASPILRLGVESCRSESITAAEYWDAELDWIHAAQQECFREEMDELREYGRLKRKSKISPLLPFLDEATNCLRVGGRLEKADIPDETKHQLILPSDHVVTSLLFDDVHRRNVHCGREHLVAAMRERYWPVRGRSNAKITIHNCLLCRIRRAKLVVPRMAVLPEFRMSASSGVFHHTGLDYFGPLYAKVRRSTVKRWGCLFTCLSTRAVHLELADTLETDDFLLCLRRFIGRRGQPRSIHSDNGTNFRGASNELKECLHSLSQPKIREFLSPLCVEWHLHIIAMIKQTIRR
ncbi:uncharacterized protein LOC135492615 [Lineus longissimus]|uniref:uncharacterized protein LOC135492615 n=1 Tax=Lineus longissimus TaxID=88925 RepID=UPI00315D97CA